MALSTAKLFRTGSFSMYHVWLLRCFPFCAAYVDSLTKKTFYPKDEQRNPIRLFYCSSEQIGSYLIRYKWISGFDCDSLVPIKRLPKYFDRYRSEKKEKKLQISRTVNGIVNTNHEWASTPFPFGSNFSALELIAISSPIKFLLRLAFSPICGSNSRVHLYINNIKSVNTNIISNSEFSTIFCNKLLADEYRRGEYKVQS